jgi:hypothetical protein
MLINDLMTAQEICEAFHDIAGDINILYDAAQTALDDKDNGELDLSDDDFQELQQVFEILDNLTAYV